jgi:hypothetical protein
MKTEFPKLLKDMRLALNPEFKAIVNDSTLTAEQLDKALMEIEAKQERMVKDHGYTQEEFAQLIKEHFIDFSSANPDEWIVKPDTVNPQIITAAKFS